MPTDIFKIKILIYQGEECTDEDCGGQAVAEFFVVTHHTRQQRIRHSKYNRKHGCEVVEAGVIIIILLLIRIKIRQQKQQCLKIESPKDWTDFIFVGVDDDGEDSHPNQRLNQNKYLFQQSVLLPHWINDYCRSDEIVQ